MAKWALVGCLILVMFSGSAFGQGQEAPKESKVSVSLSLSSDEFDPSTPSKLVMKCVVRNGTGEAIQVPADYDGNRLRVHSTNRMVLYRIRENDLDRLKQTITSLKGKIAATDDPEELRSLALSLAEAAKSKKELDSKESVRIEPGKERVVFEIPLDESLLNGQTNDGALTWGWRLRLSPPKSPIYLKAGSRDLAGGASFSVRLEVGGQTVDSNQVRLKVKSND